MDRAEYRLEGERQWRDAEEILRIDNAYRQKLGLPLREAKLAQPWAQPDPGPAHALHLRFEIPCTQRVEGARLALEHPERAVIRLDGRQVPSQAFGWFVDKAIQTIALPSLDAGTHWLELDLSIDLRVGAEWCYLLGDFSVSVQGVHKTLGAPVRRLGFGDVTAQGLPFYCGNISYHLPMDACAGLGVEVSHYRGALLGLAVDAQEERPLAFAPYRMRFDGLTPGPHTLHITLYGNRHNGFGPLHNADETLKWIGPNCWRSKGAAWCEEYRLKPLGILTAPRVDLT